MSRKTKHTAEFKARMAREAIEGKSTLNEMSTKHSVHPNMISKWKSEALDGLIDIFSTKREKKDRESEVKTDHLFQQIGELKVENSYIYLLNLISL